MTGRAGKNSNPICHPLSQKNKMLIFGLHSTSDDLEADGLEPHEKPPKSKK